MVFIRNFEKKLKNLETNLFFKKWTDVIKVKRALFSHAKCKVQSAKLRVSKFSCQCITFWPNFSRGFRGTIRKITEQHIRFLSFSYALIFIYLFILCIWRYIYILKSTSEKLKKGRKTTGKRIIYHFKRRKVWIDKFFKKSFFKLIPSIYIWIKKQIKFLMMKKLNQIKLCVH